METGLLQQVGLDDGGKVLVVGQMLGKDHGGYGNVGHEEGKDVFFHYSQLVMEGFKTIDEGAEVEFEIVETDRGPQAHNVVKL